MAVRPRVRAGRVLQAAERRLVKEYRAGLARLDKHLAGILRDFAAAGGQGYADFGAWKAGENVLALLERETARLVAMRRAIIDQEIPRVAAARYKDTLYQAQRIVDARNGTRLSKTAAPDFSAGRVSPQMMGERLAAMDGRGERLYGQIRSALASGTGPADLRDLIFRGLTQDGNSFVRVMHQMGTEVINTATEVAFETVQSQILDELGKTAKEAGLVIPWIHDEPASPRAGHILMHGSLPEGGVYTNPLTGAQADSPGGFGDPAEDRNCLCTLTVMDVAEWEGTDWAGQISAKGESFAESVVAGQLEDVERTLADQD